LPGEAKLADESIIKKPDKSGVTIDHIEAVSLRYGLFMKINKDYLLELSITFDTYIFAIYNRSNGGLCLEDKIMIVDNHCKHCQGEPCIYKVPIFSSLNHEELMNIAELIKHRQYKKGEIIIHEGEKNNSITIISNGSAKACRYTPDGKEQIVYIFTEGDFFGEHNLLTERKASYSVIALTDLRVCTLSKNDFQPLLYNYPDISIKILSELSERMYRLESAMQGMGVRNVDYRIASLLLEFAQKYGHKTAEGLVIQMPLSREGIANYLGVARETVSRKLGQMEKDGVIRSINNKSIILLDPDALKDATGA